MIKALSVSVIRHGVLRLTFSDGTFGEYDLCDLLQRGTEMTAPLQDPDVFSRVFIEFGAPTWPNGFDLAPWALHQRMKDQGTLKAVDSAA